MLLQEHLLHSEYRLAGTVETQGLPRGCKALSSASWATLLSQPKLGKYRESQTEEGKKQPAATWRDGKPNRYDKFPLKIRELTHPQSVLCTLFLLSLW